MAGEFSEGQSIPQAASVATLKRPHISTDVTREVFKTEENNLFAASSGLLGISKNESGNYVIRFPGFKDSETGNYVGVSSYETSDILKAKSFFLQQSQELESIQGNDILTFTADDIRVAFSNGINFSPRAAVRETPIEYSNDIANLLHSEPVETFINTVNTEGWQDRLFSFVKNYVESNERIQELMLNEKITDLHYLSPRQAISLVTAMVVDLTKFNEEWGNGAANLADKSTTMKLLEEANVHKNDPDWQGNGVCRNFASITKSLFDAIKSNQRRYNLLENTYCAIRTGTRQDYDPGNAADETHFVSGGDGGHAWNDFIQVSSDGLSSNITTVDVTWAERDLYTKDIVGLDHTLKRMEKSVQIMAKRIPDSKEGLVELKKILSYYDLMIKNSKESKQGKHYYAKSVLSLLKGRSTDQLDNETHNLLNSTALVYINDQAKSMERFELEGLYKLAPDSDRYIKVIVEKYLKRNKSKLLFDTRAQQLIFTDSKLQEKINQKLREMGKFDEVVQKDRYFREHMEKQNG